MKQVEFSTSSPVLYPPPLFIGALRRKLSKLYLKSHGLTPKIMSQVLAPLFHPDYLYDYSLNSQTNSVVMLNHHIHNDPQYVAERVNACVNAFINTVVPEMTFQKLIHILNQVNGIMKGLIAKSDGKIVRYHRRLETQWEFISLPKTLDHQCYGIVRNEPRALRKHKWQPLTTDDVTEIATALDISPSILLYPLRYISVKNNTFTIEPVLKEINWNQLLEPN